MLNKIKFLGIIFMSILLLTNCNKDNKQDPTKQGEMVFAPMDITPDKDWECDLDLSAVYAYVVIDGDDYYPLTFVLGGKLYTQAIKLNEGAHVLEHFALMDDMGTEDKGDDLIYKATPQAESDYAIYVDLVLPYNFTIIAFQKIELKIWVLCYIRAEYLYFGFFWFEVHEIIIREQCFFGDFCIKFVDDYLGSYYEEGGVQFDEIAIFKIIGWRNGVFFGEWDNELTYGQGPMCIQYADRLDELDEFTFELWIYVKVGATFEYVKFYEWYFMDEYLIPNGDDGVVEFVLGNCNYTETDFLLPPYLNLPCDFQYQVIQYPYEPSYFKVMFSGIGAGFDIGNGEFDAWCADLGHTIGVGPIYDMCAYNSLYPWLLPNSCGPNFIDWSTKGPELNQINWLFNNLDILPAATAGEFQDAIWIIMGDLPINGGVSGTIATLAAAHEDFSPLIGGWAAVLIYEIGGDCANTQITFRVVDP